MSIHSSGQIIFNFTHIEGITLDTGEEVDDVGGGPSGMVSVRVSEAQAAGVYGAGFTVESLARVGARERIWGLGIKIGSNK